jgi:hypothetical protein
VRLRQQELWSYHNGDVFRSVGSDRKYEDTALWGFENMSSPFETFLKLGIKLWGLIGVSQGPSFQPSLTYTYHIHGNIVHSFYILISIICICCGLSAKACYVRSVLFI